MKRILVLMGGQSSEHSVSLRSGMSVLAHINTANYEVIPVGIDHQGRWLAGKEGVQSEMVIHRSDHKKIALHPDLEEVRLEAGVISGAGFPAVIIDAVFSVLHGTFGEDGCMQGLCKMQHIPFIGADLTASAVAMDKDLFKRLLAPEGIPMADWVTLYDYAEPASYDEVSKKLGPVLFIKPACQGSSVGVSKATDEASYNQAVKEAFQFDRKVLVEECITGREVEMAVLGNEELLVSAPSEVITEGDFYTYESKYVTDDATLILKADLPEEQITLLQETAKKAYRLMGIEGFARMDFFAGEKGEIWFNEPNTLPGFTSISMYPKMMEGYGIGYPELIDRLLELAFARFKRQEILKSDPSELF